jgi:hypothetical protein
MHWQSKPFNASQYDTAGELLMAHQQWQAQALKGALQAAAGGTPYVPPKAVLYTQVPEGWGNRLSSVVTGDLFCMARMPPWLHALLLEQSSESLHEHGTTFDRPQKQHDGPKRRHKMLL